MQTNFVMQCCLRTCGWCINLWLMRHPILRSMCTDEWLPTLVQYAPSVFPAKKKQVLSCSHAQNKTQVDNFLAFGGYFERKTYRVMALCWLKKEEERRRWTILTFYCFRFNCYFKIVTKHWYYYCRLGQAHYKLLYVLLDASIICMLIHWLKPPSCFQAIPTYGLATVSHV